MKSVTMEGGDVKKIVQICVTSFMDDPLSGFDDFDKNVWNRFGVVFLNKVGDDKVGSLNYIGLI